MNIHEINKLELIDDNINDENDIQNELSEENNSIDNENNIINIENPIETNDVKLNELTENNNEIKDTNLIDDKKDNEKNDNLIKKDNHIIKTLDNDENKEAKIIKIDSYPDRIELIGGKAVVKPNVNKSLKDRKH